MNIKEKTDLINTPVGLFETGKELLKDGHELVDTLSEYSPYLKVGSKWMNYRREKKCKEFLQGLGMKILSKEELTFADLQKLDELLKKNANRLLVLDILEEATKTASDTSSKLLGIIAGQVMEEERGFDYNDWILVNGLKNMNNWDIESFKKIYSYFEAYPKKTRVNAIQLLLNISEEEYEQLMNDPSQVEARVLEKEKRVMESEEYKTLRSSLMRINSFQILTLGPITFDNDTVNFERSQAGNKLYRLIKEIE
ncbi:TPA: hypothetical protein ACTZ3H_002790 [Bacillus cereus]